MKVFFFSLVLILGGGAFWVFDSSKPQEAVSPKASLVSIKIPVEGMTCDSCAAHIQKKLSTTAGVQGAKVSFLAGLAEVDMDQSLIDKDFVQGIIEGLGYSVTDQK